MQENLERILSEISCGNNLGEKITLLGATKYVDITRINEAIDLGLSHIGENKAQELRDKFYFYKPVCKHFIGRIQQNKLKYLVGKADIIDSVDSLVVANKISELAERENIVQNIMLEVNIGGEEQKGGFKKEDVIPAYKSINALKGIKIIGIMSMLPRAEENVITSLCKDLRNLYEQLKSTDKNIKYLSVGTSADYKITIKNGANMIRLGTSIFGERR